MQAGQAEEESSSPGSSEPLLLKKVMSCLQEDPLPVIALKVPLEFIQPEVVIEPAIATMCASCVVQDEASGVTYMEMVTTSVGQVTLNCANPVVQNPQLTIRDINDLPKEEGDDNHL